MPQIRQCATQWSRPDRHAPSVFGDLAVVAFLLMQALDGILTYVGVASMGTGIEANPVMASLMAHLGPAAALAGAKLLAGSLGVLLHLRGVHRVIALLTSLYLFGAIVPWMAVLAH